MDVALPPKADIVDDISFGGHRGSREVYEELLCDWPLLAPDDASTLTDSLPPNTVCKILYANNCACASRIRTNGPRHGSDWRDKMPYGAHA